MTTQKTENRRVSLKLVQEPGLKFVTAPPLLVASTHTVDFVCGTCEAVLLHAELDQVHNLVIHCAACGSFNTTDI